MSSNDAKSPTTAAHWCQSCQRDPSRGCGHPLGVDSCPYIEGLRRKWGCDQMDAELEAHLNGK